MKLCRLICLVCTYTTFVILYNLTRIDQTDMQHAARRHPVSGLNIQHRRYARSTDRYPRNSSTLRNSLTTVILSSDGGEPNALGETFPYSPFATRHLLDTSADKNETSGLGECLRFLAVRCTYARNFMQSHLVTSCKCLCKLFYSERCLGRDGEYLIITLLFNAFRHFYKCKFFVYFLLRM